MTSIRSTSDPAIKPAISPSALQTARGGLLHTLGRRAVVRAVSGISHGAIRIIEPDGSLLVASPSAERSELDGKVHTVRVHDTAFFAAAAFGGGIGLAEAYLDGHWTCDDLAGLIETMTVNIHAARGLEGPVSRMLSPLSLAAYWLQKNTRRGSRRNILAHYDLGNDFFALFLDPTMTYSSGVFERGAKTLEQAQIEKMDLACRKLELRPQDHLLEIGTGWGGMAIHAAKTYGCRVTTTTISDRQFDLASRRIREAGLANRIRVIQQDYRDLSGTYDKLVSIEMIEAVGRAYLDRFFDVCSRSLKPDGAALIQAIVIRDQDYERAARRRDFLKKYIFPGSCLLGVRAMADSLARCTDLRIWHMEDFGPHYASTLRLWREAFMNRLDEVRNMGHDERFIRMWEYYLAYCQGVFAARQTGVVQMLLTKPMCRIAPAGGSVSRRVDS